jgi:hypothetical protein
MKQTNELQKKLDKAFTDLSKTTVRLYSHWIIELAKFHAPLKLSELEQWHIDEYLAWMVRPGEYSRSTTNQAKRAIKLFFKAIEKPVEVQMVSTRHKTRPVDTISRDQVNQVLARLPLLYRVLASDIYYNLVPPGNAVKQSRSRGGYTAVSTLTNHVKEAAKKSGIVKPVTAMTLYQSGIIHRLEDDGPAVVREMTRLKSVTIRRYMK